MPTSGPRRPPKGAHIVQIYFGLPAFSTASSYLVHTTWKRCRLGRFGKPRLGICNASYHVTDTGPLMAVRLDFEPPPSKNFSGRPRDHKAQHSCCTAGLALSLEGGGA